MTARAPLDGRQVWALVPVKAAFQTKMRLSGRLSMAERARLQWAMLQDVLDALERATRICRIAVVSHDARFLQMAQSRGMLAIGDEPQGGGLNAAVQCGTARLRAAGADLIVILPGDVPLLDAAEIDLAVDLALQEDIALVAPDRTREGTNALVFRPDRSPRFQYGHGSFRRHLEERGAYRASAFPMRSIARDIDTPDDLAHLCRQHGGNAAPHTQVVLHDIRNARVSAQLPEEDR